LFSKLIVLGLIFLLVNSINTTYAQNEEKIVIFSTPSGKLAIEFFPQDAPKTVENFIDLAESDFYQRTIFHRIIKDFMIQGGDPKTKPGEYDKITDWGTGNPGYFIPAEFNTIKHNRGIVSMARTADPDSAGSQFFIVHKNSNFLDGEYTAFGRLVTQESYDTLDRIASLEVAPNDIAYDWGAGEIQKIEVVNRSELENILELGEPERTLTLSITELGEEKYSNTNFGFTTSVF